MVEHVRAGSAGLVRSTGKSGSNRSRPRTWVRAAVLGVICLMTSGALSAAASSAAAVVTPVTVVPPTTWVPRLPAQSPPATSDGSMAYDPAIGRLVLVPGAGLIPFVMNETWTYNGTTWTELAANASPAVADASMAYDPAIGQMVLFGGTDVQNNPGGTWLFDGTTWTQASPTSSPPPLSFASMAYDPAIGQVVLFGGAGGPFGRGSGVTPGRSTARPGPRC